MDCSPPGSSVLGISQARILESFPSPGDLPDPGIKPMSPELAGRFFTTEPSLLQPYKTYSLRKPPVYHYQIIALFCSFNSSNITHVIF